MIIQHTADRTLVLFNPEDLKERKTLDSFPGLLRQGLQFYCPNKQNLVYNLYQRLKRKIKNIKFTPEIKEMILGDIVIKELPSDFKFHTKPLKHQLIALRFAYTFGCFLNLSEPGLGKTKVTLDFIWLMKARKSLIVCPKSLRFVWEEETATHRPELSVYVVETTDWEIEAEKINKADIVVINYDKAVALEEALKRLQFDFVAVDEGLIKNPSTERTKALTRLSKGIPNRCVMSGTLVNNSPLDVFAPLRFVEPALVGESFSKFRDEYALVSRKNRFITVGYRNVPEVKDMLASCGIIMTKKEWLTSLPPKEFHRKYVQMGNLQHEYYHKLASNYLLQIPELGVEIEVDNPLSTLIKLNQISNGFIYYKDNPEETLNELYGTESRKRSKDNRKTYFFEEQPKVEALLKLVRSEEFNSMAGPESLSESRSPGSEESIRGSKDGYGSNTERYYEGDYCRESSSGYSKARGRDVSSGDEPVRRPAAERSDSTGDGSSRGSDNKNSNENELRSYNGNYDPEQGHRRKSRPCTGTNSSAELSDTNVSTILQSRISSTRNDYELGERTESGSEGLRNSRTNLSGNTSDKRAIIWFNLDAERRLLEQGLARADISYLTIAGGCKDVGAVVRRFNTDPSIRFLLCQAKTINYGVTIMGTSEDDLAEDIIPEFDPRVSDEIFYSLNFSLEVFLQQQDRIHRIGQVRKCRYWLILTNSKIERHIATRLEEKLICNKEILVDIMDSLGQDMLES